MGAGHDRRALRITRDRRRGRHERSPSPGADLTRPATARARRVGPGPLADAVRGRLASRDGLLLVLDYDGTLARIAPTPAGARLGPKTAEVLKRLADRERTAVAVVSGRTLDDLAGVLPPVEGLYRFGTHGAEGRGPDGSVINAALVGPPPRGLRELAERVRREPWPSGVFAEDKGSVVTLHYRLADPEDAAQACDRFLDLVRVTVAGSESNVLHGRQVIEVRAVGVDKGAAVRWLRREVGLNDPLVVYVGDDVTDEDGFGAVGEAGVAVLVAARSRPTRAQWRLSDPAEVLDFLGELDRNHRPQNL